MKKLLCMISVVLLFAGLAVAQSGSSDDQENGSTISPSMENPPGAGHEKPGAYETPAPSNPEQNPGSMSGNTDSTDPSNGNDTSRTDQPASDQNSEEMNKSESSSSTETDSTTTTTTTTDSSDPTAIPLTISK